MTGRREPAGPCDGVTQAVGDYPLFQAVSDPEDRVGIAQKWIDPGTGDYLNRDPSALAGSPAAEVAGPPARQATRPGLVHRS